MYQNGYPDRIPKAYYASTASWRSVSVTQPPTTYFDLNLNEVEYCRSGGQVLTVRNPEGISFGELYEWWMLHRREYEAKTSGVYDSRWAGL